MIWVWIFVILNVSFAFADKFLFYQVRKGDSYTKIAKLYKLNYSEILDLNRKKKIFPRTIIKVTPHYYYKIKKGDTLINIANQHQISLKALQAINRKISGSKIFHGNFLKIPFPDEIDFINQFKEKNLTGVINIHLLNNQEKKIIEPLNDFEIGSKSKLPLKINWPLNKKNNDLIIRVVNKEGLLIEAQENYRKVYASQKGKVSYVGNVRGYGKSIFLEHAENIFTVYLGLRDVGLKKNQLVAKGNFMGSMKKYLYFFVFVDGLPVDPNAIF